MVNSKRMARDAFSLSGNGIRVLKITEMQAANGKAFPNKKPKDNSLTKLYYLESHLQNGKNPSYQLTINSGSGPWTMNGLLHFPKPRTTCSLTLIIKDGGIPFPASWVPLGLPHLFRPKKGSRDQSQCKEIMFLRRPLPGLGWKSSSDRRANHGGNVSWNEDLRSRHMQEKWNLFLMNVIRKGRWISCGIMGFC
jgi:hypothetical protein